MIKLGTAKTQPRRLALAAGAAILYRPATTLDQEAAQAAARRTLEAARDGLEALESYGVPADLPFGDDGDLAFALVSLVNQVELGLRVIVSWEGIGDADGRPAEVNRENLAALLRDPIVFTLFKSAIMAPILEMEFEGNGSALSPNGAPAGAEPIAQAVEKSARPAPQASAVETARAVPSTPDP